MKNFYQKGISLMELLIVLAIVGIIVAIAVSQFSKIRNAQILKSTTEDILSVLNKARSQTLASLNSLQYGVRFETNRVVIFNGTTYDSNNASNEVINISSIARISSIALTDGVTDIYFNRLNGTASNTGTIVVSISSDVSLSKIITISKTGGVSVN
jgi:prepilin-type N-terminal cleavage/methylation domain-containing protein